MIYFRIQTWNFFDITDGENTKFRFSFPLEFFTYNTAVFSPFYPLIPAIFFFVCLLNGGILSVFPLFCKVSNVTTNIIPAYYFYCCHLSLLPSFLQLYIIQIFYYIPYDYIHKVKEIIIIIIIIYHFRVFHISISWRIFTGGWVTASFLKSPGLFSVCWPSSLMLSFGWSPLVRQLSNPPGPLVTL